jgi:predicted dehydrogenase
VKVLLVGLGRWGEKHLRVLGDLGCEVWVSDHSAERRAFAVKAGVAESRAVGDFRAALPHVDAVDLVTPADTHLALASECLRAGKDCFVEKPLTLTVAEGHALAQVVRSTDRILQVGHIFRFHPVTQFMRERIRGGAVGSVRYCTGRFSGFKRPRTDVGVTQTDGIHYFDLFAYLLGQAPTAVTATLQDFLGRGMDDLSFCSVEYGQVPTFVEAGYFAPGTYRDCVVVGETATLAGDFGTGEVRVLQNVHVKLGGAWQAPEGAIETHKATGREPLAHELELFLESVTKRTPPAVDVEAGLTALRVVEAAHESSRLGRRVLLSEVG